MQVRTARELGAAIKGARLERGWTQHRLAEAAQVTRQWVSAMERGKPTAEVAPILRCLVALDLAIDLVPATRTHGGVDLDDLLGGRHG